MGRFSSGDKRQESREAEVFINVTCFLVTIQIIVRRVLSLTGVQLLVDICRRFVYWSLFEKRMMKMYGLIL